jgi:hypothetical protein
MEMKTLGGAMFVWNGNSQDYSYKENIRCLLELCDEVSIVCGGDDGTSNGVMSVLKEDSSCKKVWYYAIDQQQWDEQKGREKLAYFMNMALDFLQTDWAFSLQADEIIHERSFPHIREAIEWTGAHAFVSLRYNMWRDPLSMLDVIQERKPCSSEVIRLAKAKYRAYGDGEHIASDIVDVFPKPIEIYHVGYIRDPVKHVIKAKNVLVDIFGMEMDKRFGDKFDYRNFPAEEFRYPLPFASLMPSLFAAFTNSLMASSVKLSILS